MRKLIYLFCLSLALALPAKGMPEQISERDMKTALIYNFAVFTTWPLIAGETFNICVFEEDRENINNHLLSTKKISGKQTSLLVIRNINAINNCQVLYLEAKKIRNKRLADTLQNNSILTIVNSTENTTNTGIINILLINNRFNFTINNETARDSNLTLSSRLLRLAAEVY